MTGGTSLVIRCYSSCLSIKPKWFFPHLHKVGLVPELWHRLEDQSSATHPQQTGGVVRVGEHSPCTKDEHQSQSLHMNTVYSNHRQLVSNCHLPPLNESPSVRVIHWMALAAILVPKFLSNGDGAPPCTKQRRHCSVKQNPRVKWRNGTQHSLWCMT